MVSLEDAKTILEPYLDRLSMCVEKAIEEYWNLPAELRVKCSARTRACLINDFMVMNARTEFAGDSDVIPKDSKGQFYVYVRDEFRVKFKKLNNRLRPSNILTRQATSFLNQEVQLPLPEMPSPMTNLVVGYLWNASETDASVYIVCPNGRDNEWAFEVELKPIDDMAKVLSVVTESNDTPRVRPKEGVHDSVSGK